MGIYPFESDTRGACFSLVLVVNMTTSPAVISWKDRFYWEWVVPGIVNIYQQREEGFETIEECLADAHRCRPHLATVEQYSVQSENWHQPKMVRQEYVSSAFVMVQNRTYLVYGYTCVERYDTFKKLWKGKGLYRAFDLAHAGFHSLPCGTVAQCEYCGGSVTLSSLEEDRAMIMTEIHREMSPDCSFNILNFIPDSDYDDL